MSPEIGTLFVDREMQGQQAPTIIFSSTVSDLRTLSANETFYASANRVTGVRICALLALSCLQTQVLQQEIAMLVQKNSGSAIAGLQSRMVHLQTIQSYKMWREATVKFDFECSERRSAGQNFPHSSCSHLQLLFRVQWND
jgi:hypothetical protein